MTVTRVGALGLGAAGLTAVADVIFYTTGHKGRPVRAGEIVFDFVPLIVASLLLIWRPARWSFGVAGALLALQPLLDLFFFNSPQTLLAIDNPIEASIYVLVTIALALALSVVWFGLARARAPAASM